ncbi:MAG: hypothetical protein ACI4HI_02715 [Lachnospiraceae bacterium]
MENYKKRIVSILMVMACLVMCMPVTTYAKEQPLVQETGLSMKVGDKITIRVKNMINAGQWKVSDNRYAKVDTSDAKNVKIIAKKTGKVVVRAKYPNFTVQYDIKITKHPLQKKTPNVYIYAGRADGIGEVSWKPIKGAQGYCIYRKEGKKMIKIKTVKDPKAKKAEFEPYDGKYQDDYQVYVRAYTKKNGVTIYSAYSKEEEIAE